MIFLLFFSLLVFRDCSGNVRNHFNTPLLETAQLSEKMNEIYLAYNSTGAISYLADSNHICGFGSAGSAQFRGRSPKINTGRIHMGSNTKSMTAALVGILLENNLIKGQTNGWKTQLLDIVPDYVKGTPYEQVTLESLSAHFSGLDGNPPNFWDFDIPSQSLVQQRDNVTRAAFASTPINPPNSKFLYSNWGMIVLGHLVEISLGISWEDAILQYFLRPLEMVEPDASYYPFGAPTEKDANWGHIPLSETIPHFPCDPNHPPHFETKGAPTFKCDNPAYLGPAGTYSGKLLNTANYYIWLVQCSQGLGNTQEIVPLSQQGCLELMEAYGPMYPENPSGGGYGHGWAIADVMMNGEKVKLLNHAGSNNYNIVEVEIYPTLGKIYWAGTNSGYSTDTDMIHKILADLKTYDFIHC
jgi:CubicO group peptidase (beta-lactamase class C family)